MQKKSLVLDDKRVHIFLGKCRRLIDSRFIFKKQICLFLQNKSQFFSSFFKFTINCLISTGYITIVYSIQWPRLQGHLPPREPLSGDTALLAYIHPGQRVHIQALVCAPTSVCALICAPEFVFSLIYAPVCSPKLVQALVCALLCAPRFLYVLVCPLKDVNLYSLFWGLSLALLGVLIKCAL